MTRKAKKNKIKEPIPAVQKSLAIIEFLASQNKGYTLSELSRAFKLPVSTTSSILYSLVYCGYLSRDEKGNFSTTMKLLSEATKILNKLELREVALPCLKHLSNETGLASMLSIRDGHEIVCIEKIEGKSEIRIASSAGRRFPMHATCTGKAFIAYLSEEEVEEIVITAGLDPVTENTIHKQSVLKKELNRVRAQGFAVDDQEYTIGLKGIAAPIFEHNGKVIAAVSTGGAVFEIDNKMKQIITAVKNNASEISAKLGFSQTVVMNNYQLEISNVKKKQVALSM